MENNLTNSARKENNQNSQNNIENSDNINNYVTVLNHKTNRTKSKNKNPNKKRQLLHQLEFYFSDINLLNDKFLRNVINNDPDKGVDINIILNFNKIKSLLSFKEDQKSKINYIKKAIENSKKIKIMKNKIIRIEKFEINKLNKKEIDNKTIYIENIPNDIRHDSLYEIFSKYGKVLHVSIPKFNDSKLGKGFGFITFNKIQEMENAIQESNNTIPKEFINLKSSHDLEPLNVISKNVWTDKKKEFKKLRQELISENKDLFADCFSQDTKNMTSLSPGSLVRLVDLPNNIKIDKSEIKTWISNFIEPAYVDYILEINQCIVRFSHHILAKSFINKINSDDHFLFYNKKLQANLLEGEDENNYFKKVEKLKEEFGKNKCSKKNKK